MLEKNTKMLRSENIVPDVSVSNMISFFLLLRLTVLNAHIRLQISGFTGTAVTNII